MQKGIIIIMTKCGVRESCRMKFKDLNILFFYSQFIFSLLIYGVNNKNLFNTNMEYHNYETRYKLDLHQPTVKLAKYYKGLYNKGTAQ
jgi:hypothetical protein